MCEIPNYYSLRVRGQLNSWHILLYFELVVPNTWLRDKHF
ncbi:hypothetical protein PROFUN_05180 [Planoprotostelium fungivorum]|uniref:Uncharacterized protein n=1 Tax=Planoprotostelium fungivorum TaxID=1890364 RepID=A0A2P6NRE3_9EUKA|nr:hypothetical protein PROFUN_05180 [Planoprotostelium fungivorum]